MGDIFGDDLDDEDEKVKNVLKLMDDMSSFTVRRGTRSDLSRYKVGSGMIDYRDTQVLKWLFVGRFKILDGLVAFDDIKQRLVVSLKLQI